MIRTKLLILFIYFMAAQLAATAGPIRLAATAGRTRRSRADAALDRLAAGPLEADAEAESEGDNDGGDGDEALDALVGYEEPALKVRQGKFARAVKLLVHRKTLPTSCPAAWPPDDLAVTYQLLTDDPITVAAAREIAFGKMLNRSGREEAQASELCRRRFRRVRFATLYRYCLHMNTALGNMLAANSRHACASMRFKWDETQQVVQVGAEVFVPEDGRAQVSCLTPTTMHVMTFGIFIKHTALDMPYRYYVPARLLLRTTAECIWAAFCQACDIGPWLQVPNAQFACFVWFIFCADEAPANKRFLAACETRLAETAGHRALCVFLPCLLHILHRIVVPLLKGGNLLNELFRAANVLQQSTYLGGLIQSIGRKVGSTIVVVHEDDIDQPRLTRIAEAILRLTLCEGKAEDEVGKRVQQLFIHLSDYPS